MARDHFHIHRVDNGWQVLIYNADNSGSPSAFVAETHEKLMGLIQGWLEEGTTVTRLKPV